MVEPDYLLLVRRIRGCSELHNDLFKLSDRAVQRRLCTFCETHRFLESVQQLECFRGACPLGSYCFACARSSLTINDALVAGLAKTSFKTILPIPRRLCYRLTLGRNAVLKLVVFGTLCLGTKVPLKILRPLNIAIGST